MTNTTTPERRSRLHAARDRIAAALAEREAEAQRRAQLPAAICRTCGTAIPAGSGTRAAEPEYAEVWEREGRKRLLETLAPELDGWRRQCDGCAAAAARGELELAAVSAIAGRSVSAADARAVVAELNRWELNRHAIARGASDAEALTHVPGFPTAETSGRWAGAPWAHVTDDDRDRVRSALRAAIAERSPGRCKHGACAYCGRQSSTTWHPSPLTWPDGSAAPLCSDCHAVHVRRGQPRDAEGVAHVVAELATGRPVPLGAHVSDDVRPFAQSHAADREGLPIPWSYSPGISDLRHQVWSAFPEYAPPELRADAQRWHDEAEAESRARHAEARSAEAAAHW